MGRALKVSWEESAEELYELYPRVSGTPSAERAPTRLVAAEKRPRPAVVAAELAGVGKRTVERWLSW
jgi:hypothetical protein